MAQAGGSGAGEARGGERDPEGARRQGEGAQIGLAYLRWSKTAVEAAAVFVFAFMLAINSAEIAYRFAFNRGLGWVQELSIIAAMTLYFFVYALIAKEREYIRIELLARGLGPQGRRRLSMATRAVVLVFHAMVAWFAVKTARFAALFETPVLGWPEWVFFAPIAVGCADIVVTELLYFWWQVRRTEPPRAEHAGILS